MFRLLAAAAVAMVCANLRAAVVAVKNGTEKEVSFTLSQGENPALAVKLRAGETRALRVGRTPAITVNLAGKPETHKLEPYAAYAFTQDRKGPPVFRSLEFCAPLPNPADVPETPVDAKAFRVPVHFSADDADPRSKEGWERDLRKRLAAASEILENQCGMSLGIEVNGDWKSDPDATDLESQLEGFERAFPAKADVLLLGCMTRPPKGASLFGTLRAPWGWHLLMREGEPKAESARLEVLVHHLGLYAGAVRSSDPNSVMSSRVGNGRTAKADFRIAFDALNLLAIHVWIEERRAGVRSEWSDLSPEGRERLLVLYRTQAKLNEQSKSGDLQAKEYAEALDAVKRGDALKTLPRPDARSPDLYKSLPK